LRRLLPPSSVHPPPVLYSLLLPPPPPSSSLSPYTTLFRSRDQPLKPRHERVSTAEVIQDDDASAGTADTAHFAGDGHRIGNDADHVRGIYDVERIVGELQVRGVHLQKPYVPHPFARDAVARLLEHGARQVDARDRAVARI